MSRADFIFNWSQYGINHASYDSGATNIAVAGTSTILAAVTGRCLAIHELHLEAEASFTLVQLRSASTVITGRLGVGHSPATATKAVIAREFSQTPHFILGTSEPFVLLNAAGAASRFGGYLKYSVVDP